MSKVEERAREWAVEEVYMTLDSPHGVAPEEVNYEALKALVADARKFAALGYAAGYRAALEDAAKVAEGNLRRPLVGQSIARAIRSLGDA